MSIHINTGGGSWALRAVFDCPVCEHKEARIVVYESGSPWYGPRMTCVECGDSWSEGYRQERPFVRGWRQKAQAQALADFEAAPPLGTQVTRDWSDSGGGYITGFATPERIQLSRRKGWRKPENTVVVSRPSKWGNPFIVKETDMGWHVERNGDRVSDTRTDLARTRQFAANTLRSCIEYDWDEYPSLAVIRSELAGKNLACWCPLDQPCHADVLLELANGARS